MNDWLNELNEESECYQLLEEIGELEPALREQYNHEYRMLRDVAKERAVLKEDISTLEQSIERNTKTRWKLVWLIFSGSLLMGALDLLSFNYPKIIDYVMIATACWVVILYYLDLMHENSVDKSKREIRRLAIGVDHGALRLFEKLLQVEIPDYEGEDCVEEYINARFRVVKHLHGKYVKYRAIRGYESYVYLGTTDY